MPRSSARDGADVFADAGRAGAHRHAFARPAPMRPGAVVTLDNGDTFHGTYRGREVDGRGAGADHERARLRRDDGALGIRLRPGRLQGADRGACATRCWRSTATTRAAATLFFEPYRMIERGRRPRRRHRHRLAHRRQDDAAAFSEGVRFTLGSEELPGWIERLRQRAGRPRRRAVAPRLSAGHQACARSRRHRRDRQRPYPQPDGDAGRSRTARSSSSPAATAPSSAGSTWSSTRAASSRIAIG